MAKLLNVTVSLHREASSFEQTPLSNQARLPESGWYQ